MRRSFKDAQSAYRPVLKILHWSALGLLIAVVVAGKTQVITWGMIGVAVIWTLGFGAFGLMAKPGPALTGALRAYFMPAHLFLLGLFDICALAVLNADPGILTGAARIVVLATLAIGLLHGIFHLWRHTALGDGALRNMLPRALHGLL